MSEPVDKNSNPDGITKHISEPVDKNSNPDDITKQGTDNPSKDKNKTSLRKIKKKNKFNKITYLNDLLYCQDSKDIESIVKQQGIRSLFYSSIINEYVDNLGKSLLIKRILKIIFFVAIILVIGVLIVVFSHSINSVMHLLEANEDLNKQMMLTVCTQIIASFGTIITSIIALPRIIANYLFDSEDEKAIISVIEKIQNYDRDTISTKDSYEQDNMENKEKNQKISEDENEIPDISDKDFENTSSMNEAAATNSCNHNNRTKGKKKDKKIRIKPLNFSHRMR